MMQVSVRVETANALRALEGVGKEFFRERARILSAAAKPIAEAGKMSAPVSDRVHYGYKTTKLRRAIRAPRGMGQRVATYHPGNLSRSFRALRFRRARSKMFVGVKVARSATGVFQGNRTSGYYLPFVESRKPFWVAAVQRSEGQARQILEDGFRAIIEKHNKNVT